MMQTFLCLIGLSFAMQAGAAQRILCFGDSNTIASAVKPEEKWPAVFQSISKGTEAINAGVSGRAIGQQTGAGNGLESIDEALKTAGKVDEVIILLGTNDARGALWQEGGGAEGAAKRLQKLINKIDLYQPDGAAPPKITVCVPPPVGSKILDKWDNLDFYRDANTRIEQLIPFYREIALANGAKFVDLYNAMKAEIDNVCSADGVHFKPAGYKRIGELIAAAYEDHDKPLPPTDVKVVEGKISWTASKSKDVLGYEIRDPEEDTTLTFSTTAEAKLPEGHGNAWVYARDVYGNKSKAGKPEAKE
jgi:lysophospholipase L1-like esterase